MCIRDRLQVTADSDEDLVIREDPFNAGRVQLEVDGQVHSSIPTTLTTSSLTSIEIIGGEGDNLIDFLGGGLWIFFSDGSS